MVTCGSKQLYAALEKPSEHSSETIYLCRKELRCYNIGSQDAYGEAFIDERVSLVVTNFHHNHPPIPLFGMVETGSGVSILSYNAYHKIASATQIILQPFDTPPFATNGSVPAGGYSLKTTFVVLAGASFLRAYNVLVDLNNRKILNRVPLTPKVHACQHQVTEDIFRVVTHKTVILEPGKCRVVVARVLTEDPDSLIYQNVMVHSHNCPVKRPHVSGNNLAALTGGGLLVVPVRNPSDRRVLLRDNTWIGGASPAVFNCSPITLEESDVNGLSDCEQLRDRVFRVDVNTCVSDPTNTCSSAALSRRIFSLPLSHQDLSWQRMKCDSAQIHSF